MQPPRLGGGVNFEQQDLEGFEDEEEEEEIYNQEKTQSMPISAVVPSMTVGALMSKKTAKLDRVLQMQQKGIEESINLTNSVANSNQTSSIENTRYKEKQEGR